MLKIFFLIFMGAGIPVAIAMAGASLVYILFSGTLPPFVVIHRMVSASTVFRCWPCLSSSWPAT